MYFYEVNLYGKAHPPPDSQFSVLYSSLSALSSHQQLPPPTPIFYPFHAMHKTGNIV